MFNPNHYPTLSYPNFKIQYEQLIDQSNDIQYNNDCNIPYYYNLLISSLKQQTKMQKKYPKYFTQYQKEQHQKLSQKEIEEGMKEIILLHKFLLNNNYKYNEEKYQEFIKQYN